MPELLEEPEVIKATRSPHGYLASPLSDNISQREDGSLIVVGCPIARTGWQTYSVSDLPQELARSLGIDTSNPSASIELYRPEDEVFHPEFLASLNGAPICDNHPPGGEFVDKTNFRKYAMGHIQNVRKGTEPLEDGEWPVVADLIISAEPLIGKVLSNQARENSLGYDFSIERRGEKVCQCSMLGNHNAVVPKGRAGDYVRIDDAAPAAPPTSSTTLEAPDAPAYPTIVLPPFPTKEKHPVAEKKNWLRLFKGKHLIELARATDADPEKIMEAAEALNDSEDPLVPPVMDKAKDEVIVPPNTQVNEFKSESEDARKKMHDALDRAFDAKSKVGDADMEELKSLLDEYLSEEEEEPEHAADVPVEADPTELDAVLAGSEDCAECGMAADACECDEPGETMVESGEEVMDAEEEGGSPDDPEEDDEEDVEAEDKRKAMDRARANDGAAAVLKMLRPVIARTGDKAVQNAFNRALDSVKKSSRVTKQGTGYGGFAAAARARDKAPRNPNPDRARAGDSGKEDPMAKLQAMYNTAHKGGK